MADEKDEKPVDTTAYKTDLNSIPKSKTVIRFSFGFSGLYKRFVSCMYATSYGSWALFWAQIFLYALALIVLLIWLNLKINLRKFHRGE